MKNNNSRPALRRNWRNEWHRYTSATLGKRPQSSRRERRQYWRDEWKQREPGEFTN